MEVVDAIFTLFRVEPLCFICSTLVHGDPEDRQGLARSLFSEIVYDLDARRIVDFKLKPWADRFVVLSAALYENRDRGRATAPSHTTGHAGPHPAVRSSMTKIVLLNETFQSKGLPKGIIERTM